MDIDQPTTDLTDGLGDFGMIFSKNLMFINIHSYMLSCSHTGGLVKNENS